MSRRPTRLPRWAWNAPGGAVVEPPSGKTEIGWETSERPPAQWWNFLCNAYGEWFDFLRSASLVRWQRVELGVTLSDASFAYGVDNATVEGDDVVRRHVVAGYDGTARCVLVSQRGESWTRHTNFPGGISGRFTTAAYLRGNWYLGLDDGVWTSGGNLGFVLSSPGDGQGGSNLDGTGTWNLESIGGDISGIRVLTEDPAGTYSYVRALHRTGVIRLESGTWYPASVPSLTTDEVFTGIAHDGTKSIVVTIKGNVASADAFTYAHVGTIRSGETHEWHLVSDGAGAIIAWAKSGSFLPFYRTTDHGVTWTAITPSDTALRQLLDLQYVDGTWVAATNYAPHLWSSNDLTSWERLPLPIAAGDAGWIFAVRYVDGGWVAMRASTALVGDRAEDMANGDWTPYVTPPQLANAGWLRSGKIAATAPADSQVLRWRASTSEWEPSGDRVLVGPWTKASIAAGSDPVPSSSTYQALGLGGGAFVAVRDGSVTGVSVQLSGAPAGSDLLVSGNANGVRVLLATLTNGGAATAHATIALGSFTFTAGQLVKLEVQTGTGWTGTGLSIVGSLEVVT